MCDHIGWQCSESAEGGSEGIIQLKKVVIRASKNHASLATVAWNRPEAAAV